MTIHVTVGEARSRLDELFDAARDGEDVVVHALGMSDVRLVRADAKSGVTPEEIVRRRLNTLGIWKERVGLEPFEVPPSMTDKEVEERWNRKFGPAA